MKKLKNKFILATIILVVLVIFSQVYRVYSSGIHDTKSYVLLVKGQALLNDTFLNIAEKKEVVS